MKSILDKGFRYVPAANTDIRKTFARYLREQAAKKEREQQNKVRPIRKANGSR